MRSIADSGERRVVPHGLDLGHVGTGPDRQRRDRCRRSSSRTPPGPRRHPRARAARLPWSEPRGGGGARSRPAPTPTEASTPKLRRAPERRPAEAPSTPGSMSSPACRTLLPGSTSTDISTRPFSALVSSIRTTESAPSGITAPVEIAIASPSCTGRWRAARRGTRRRPAGSPALGRGPSSVLRAAPRSHPSKSCRIPAPARRSPRPRPGSAEGLPERHRSRLPAGATRSQHEPTGGIDVDRTVHGLRHTPVSPRRASRRSP